MHATHKTMLDAYVETRSGHNVSRRLIPAGTPGVIEYAGVIGGAHVVTFRSRTSECNICARGATPVCRIDWPVERWEEALTMPPVPLPASRREREAAEAALRG